MLRKNLIVVLKYNYTVGACDVNFIKVAVKCKILPSIKSTLAGKFNKKRLNETRITYVVISL